MKTITSGNILHILKRTLDRVDTRLISHGERVGYLMAKMLETRGDVSQKYIVDCYVLGLLHDVGAYKTEEIDQLVRFESKDVWNHSIYSYLFLKNAGTLDSLVDAVLYHHLNWNKFECEEWTVPCENKELANLIYLADRIETYIRGNGKPITSERLENFRDTRFSGELLDLFYQAEDRFHMQKRLIDGSFILDTERIVSLANYNLETLIHYIQMVAFAIDFRSEATVTHTITTVSVAMELTRLFKLPDSLSSKIYIAAYLHDLGKMAIPVEIIEKPGSLTDDEMEIMKTHVVYTGKIIKGYVSDQIYRIAVRHHEKLDGTGYPLALNGRQMTLSEKILSVADIISALSGRRSYKDPFPREQVISIIKGMAGDGKISSEVTAAAVEHYDEIISNTEENCKTLILKYEKIKQEYHRLQQTFHS